MNSEAWFKDLPYGWSSTQLRHVSRIFAGGTPDRKHREYWENGTMPWLNSGAVNQDVISTPSELISRLALLGGATRSVNARSVVVALAGQGKTKGMAARTEIRTALNQSLAAIEPSPRLDYRFLHYWLKSNYFNIRNLAGGDLRDGLNLDHVGSIQTPIPSVAVQMQIADYLDHETAEINAFIADLEVAGRFSLERWRRLRDFALTGGAGAVPDSRLWLGRCDPTWQVGPLKHLFSITLGKMLDEKKQSSGESAPYLRAANLRGGELRLDDLNSMIFDDRERDKYALAERDVLVIEGGATVGTAVVLRESLPGIYFQKTINRMRARGDASSAFYAEIMNAYRESGFLAVVGNGSTIPHLPAEKLEGLIVPIPPADEQHRLADQFAVDRASVDEVRAEIDAAIALAKERRAALITATVTGQIDVTAKQMPAVDSIQSAIEEAR